MAKLKQQQPLVSVSVILTWEQRRGLDFMARCMGLERREVLLSALDLLAMCGPEQAAGLGDGVALGRVSCAECGTQA